jgi:feruloyl esterase
MSKQEVTYQCKVEEYRKFWAGAVWMAALLAAVMLSAQPLVAAVSCASLDGMALAGNGKVTLTQSIPAGPYTAPDGSTYPNLPAFCRVVAVLKPTANSDINVEVWLPDTPGWNGRLVGTGNGGYAGAIVYSELGNTLALGFAVANTDMGSSPATALNGKPLTGHLSKQIDFGYRSTHDMTVAAKEIVLAFYGTNAAFSYFTGCSTGGGQALHEAEQFPNDYDGIVGGAPAENRTHVHTDIMWDFYVTHQSSQSVIPESLLTLVTQSAVAACNKQNGGLASDPFITDPRSCTWDPGALLCKGIATKNCLNPQQVEALRLIYDGPRDPRTGDLIYPGANRGSESGSLFDLGAIEGLSPDFPTNEPFFDGLFYWAFGTNWNWQTFDFDYDVATLDAKLAIYQNANNADLSKFRAHDGKLLMYHGWADPLVVPQDDIDYFLRAVALDKGNLKTTHSYFRLFMAPGMGHCFTGPGPNIFGGADNPGGPADAFHNVLLALQAWVELGVAPDKIIATKYADDNPAGAVIMTRPLCVFPKVPTYNGQGNTTEASSFDCVNDGVVNNPTAAPEYLH